MLTLIWRIFFCTSTIRATSCDKVSLYGGFITPHSCRVCGCGIFLFKLVLNILILHYVDKKCSNGFLILSIFLIPSLPPPPPLQPSLAMRFQLDLAPFCYYYFLSLNKIALNWSFIQRWSKWKLGCMVKETDITDYWNKLNNNENLDGVSIEQVSLDKFNHEVSISLSWQWNKHHYKGSSSILL